MIRKVRSYIAAHRLFPEQSRLIVAVSGGADSVALLDILASCGMSLSLVVAHFNHQLRGKESDADQEFVRQAALRLGFPFRSESADVRGISRESGWGIEDGGRRLRAAFLQRVMAEESAEGVVFAHHADDQAETVLMRLLRGAGPRGLSGMAPRSGWKIRPLLEVRGEELRGYLKERNIPWRDDLSNQDERYLRNRIRHNLLPILATYNPSVVDRLAATAAVCAAESRVVEELSLLAFQRLADVGREKVSFSIEALLAERQGVRLRLYDRAVSELGREFSGTGSGHLLAVDGLINSSLPNCALSLPDMTVVREYDILSFQSGKRVPVPSFELSISGPGLYTLPDGRMFSVGVAEPGEADFSREGTEWFDADAAPFPWTIRSFKPGDRLFPFGMTGSKKVKELFIEKRVPGPERRRVPLLVDGTGNILSVCGVRRSANAAVIPETRRAVRVEFLPRAPYVL